MHRMNLHTVKAGCLGNGSSLAHGPHDTLYFFGTDCPTCNLRIPAIRNLRRCNWKITWTVTVGNPPKSCGQLHENFCSISMDPLCQLNGSSLEQNRCQRGTRHTTSRMPFHRVFGITHTGNDQSHTAFCPFCVESNCLIIERTTAVCQAGRTHGFHHIPIFNCTGTDFHRCKQLIILPHQIHLFSFSAIALIPEVIQEISVPVIMKRKPISS